ncbi:MAG: hypothetical protein E7227_05600 [Clostridiales bacterium]|nr:hypothetical protein [Clostridiales bacterium]
MKKASLIAILTSIMIMAASAFCFAEDGFDLTYSYPEDGQTNTSMENLGVKLVFSKPLNSDAAKKANADKLAIYDEDGKAIPVQILFSDDENGLVLVLADIDKGFVAKNNSEYKLVISGELIDNDGNALGADKTVTFKTYNQKVNNMVNMAMMFIMFGGIMVLSLKQNNAKEEEEAPKDAPKEPAFNPYREAKRTGKTVEEVMEEQAKKEAKEARKKARKKKNEVPQEKKIENCAELLNNVYHVHAPAPINKADRSVEALKALRKADNKKSKSSGSKKK